EQAVRESFEATIGADEVGVRRIVLGLVVHGGFSFLSRLCLGSFAPRRAPGAPRDARLHSPRAPARGMRGKQKRGTPKGGREVSRRDIRGARANEPRQRRSDRRSPNDTKRKSESRRTARLRRHCGNGLGL